MAIPAFRSGMIVRCEWPVNGLRFGAEYMITRVRYEDPWPCIEVCDSHTGIATEGGQAGYFDWRFVLADMQGIGL